jgi:hypothetical protein
MNKGIMLLEVYIFMNNHLLLLKIDFYINWVHLNQENYTCNLGFASIYLVIHFFPKHLLAQVLYQISLSLFSVLLAANASLCGFL